MSPIEIAYFVAAVGILCFALGFLVGQRHKNK